MWLQAYTVFPVLSTCLPQSGSLVSCRVCLGHLEAVQAGVSSSNRALSTPVIQLYGCEEAISGIVSELAASEIESSVIWRGVAWCALSEKQ